MNLPRICYANLFLFLLLSSSSHAAEPVFERQTIDGQIEIGYGLSVGRVDADQHPDVLLADKRDIVWYKNPGVAGEAWTKHVIAKQLTARDNVCVAARDIDGDGLVEVAIGANWNPGETSDTAASGGMFYLQRPDDPTRPWDPIPISPHDPTTHRMHWLKCEDGVVRLAVLPLHGIGNASGEGKNVLVSIYEVSDGIPKLAEQVDTSMHMTHNFDVLPAPMLGDFEIMLVAGKEGYAILTSQGFLAQVVDASQSKGAGETRGYQPDRSFAGVEPMHGSDVVLYRSHEEGSWNKQVVDTTLSEGHALAIVDLCGTEAPEIVAGWRAPNANNRVGIKVYMRDGDEWQTHLIDDNQMACEDLKVCDLDADGKIDIIAAGRATANVVVYWNRSE